MTPAHYNHNKSGFDFLSFFGAFSGLPHHRTHAGKYAVRAGHKESALDDWRKAADYLRREGEQVDPDEIERRKAAFIRNIADPTVKAFVTALFDPNGQSEALKIADAEVARLVNEKKQEASLLDWREGNAEGRDTADALLASGDPLVVFRHIQGFTETTGKPVRVGLLHRVAELAVYGFLTHKSSDLSD